MEGGSHKEHPLVALHQSVSCESQTSDKRCGGPNSNGIDHSPEKSRNGKMQSLNDTVEKGRLVNDAGSNHETSVKVELPSFERNGVKVRDKTKAAKYPKENKKLLAMNVLKTTATIALLPLWILLLHSVIINLVVKDEPSRILLDVSDTMAAAKVRVVSFSQECSDYFVSMFAAHDKRREFVPVDEAAKWLDAGRDLLRRYDDASGSVTSCKNALHAILDKKHWSAGDLSSDASSLALLDADKSRLLSKALVCIGEARLALFSSPLGSTANKLEYLMEAIESFETANALDPTNPSVRSGLGLSCLLLGLMKYHEGDSMQRIVQSIQHLKAALGLAEDLNEDGSAVAGRTAVMHNLGLAYIALDGILISENKPGAEATHFTDYVASLRSSQISHSVLESSAFSSNEGSSLLQMGEIEDAVAILESTAGDVCADSSPYARQREACSIVLQNLSVAKIARYGEQEESTIIGRPDGGAKIHNDVMHWNTNTMSDFFSAGVPDKVSTDTTATVLHPNIATLDTATKNEVKNDAASVSGKGYEWVSEDIGDGVEVEPETNYIRTNDESNSVMELSKTNQIIGPASTYSSVKKMKPEMHNALLALEKAATERPQRTRVLLTLARARSSAGDKPGAVDAALKAINAATSVEETESSTSYLEILMRELAGEEMVTKGDGPIKKQDERSSFVESRDFALSELQLKLEVERLKYKVLEQEMMLGRYHDRSSLYTENEKVKGDQSPMVQTRSIDYGERVEKTMHEIPSPRISDQVQNSNMMSKAPNEPIEHTSAGRVENGHLSVEDVTVRDKAHKVKESETLYSADHNPNDEDISGSTVFIESVDVDSELPPVPVTLNESGPVDNHGTMVKNETDMNTGEVAEEEQSGETLELPSLFNPPLKQPGVVPPTAKSYMKMADAYLDKGQYALASKQFLKVIKKAPDHLPAHLGYATALERSGKRKQVNTAALAYGNATKIAIMQGDRIDPMAKSGTGGIAENIMMRAVQVTKSAPSDRLETLRLLSAYAHTAALAADAYFEVGLEITKNGIDQGEGKDDALRAFAIANEFVAIRNDSEVPYHVGSTIELGKLALDYEGDAARAIQLFEKVKEMHMEDVARVQLLVLVGRAHASLGEVETAIAEFTRALSFPQCSPTASAHHELAIALTKSGGDMHEIKTHFEKALDMGFEPSPDAVEALGERNVSLMRALNRQYYKSFNNADSSGGGIMSGGGVGSQQTSAFAPHAKQSEEGSVLTNTLTLIEQGAASYDGHTPMGGEVEGTESSLSSLKANKSHGPESSLSDLKR